MCQAIIDMKKEAYDNGVLKGEESGFLKGEESGFLKCEENIMSKIALRMYNGKYDLQEISNVTGLDTDRIEKIIRTQVQ